MAQQNVTICIDAYPDAETDVFRIGAADDILRLLADAHETEFTIPDLVDATDVTRSTVWRAVDLLDSIGAVRIRKTARRNYVSINPDRLQKDDPILAIEQSEFHAPIRTVVTHIREAASDADEIDDVVGIVVFGSVARGEADRQSDIDLFVVVDGDRTTARRMIADVVAGLQEQRFDGDRFDFEPYVESTASSRRAGPKLREIFTEGVTVYGSEQLQSLRKAVIGGE
ncbi:DNA polymerase beta domain-containing protein region [Natrialba hulunbeirensis JCM 10989]|uniref:DNA polymerase beta domain-containing protein region n=1 Tax=Natrialba hulunbeirensis JCM 10989 TaxID=1227493 RepID=L9ZUL1_9EURY|nr:nucleotidyltransferase domain-containing protein [Natrialba hulunbeirensis]ELY90170.1 DNA polymerase beta domain-containing protein region [Natrialba hulunbeirensis JCM 10989]